MAEIGRTSRIQEKEVRTQLDRMEMIEALRHGNIYEVFAKHKTFKIGEFLDFFASQWRAWKGELLQDAEVKADEASYPEPNASLFPVHHRGAAISEEDGGYLRGALAEFLRGRGFKAQAVEGEGVGEADEAALAEGRLSPEELEEMARGTLGDWETFMEETWSQILDAQMMDDYRSRMSEVQQEVQRVIALAKQGAISPEFVLIALAKVNATKNGVLLTWLGKKAFHVNESLSRIASDLHTLSPTDPRYASELQMAQSKTREGAFQLQLLQTDMQKVMQDVASVLEQVHSMMGEINRTRREIITKVAAQ